MKRDRRTGRRESSTNADAVEIKARGGAGGAEGGAEVEEEEDAEEGEEKVWTKSVVLGTEREEEEGRRRS